MEQGRAFEAKSSQDPIRSIGRQDARRPRLDPVDGIVPRALAIERLDSLRSTPSVFVIAPPGYGKTTLLSRWAVEDGREVTWISLQGTDQDPSRILELLAPALERRTRSVIVLDDAHEIRTHEAWDVIGSVITSMNRGSQLIIAGRMEPSLPLARLVLEGSAARLGPTELALTQTEARILFRVSGVDMSRETFIDIFERTEGWPAALSFAVRHFRGQSVAQVSWSGALEAMIDEYLREEVLAGTSEGDRRFMTETAILERLSPQSCNAILGREDAEEMLAHLSRTNLFLFPLEDDPRSHRWHPLWRRLLLSELRSERPERERELHGLAARWFEDAGELDDAIRHACTAGDYGRAATLIGREALALMARGRTDVIDRWMELIPSEEIGRNASLAAIAGQMAQLSGDQEEARHWISVLEHLPPSAEPLADGRASAISAAAFIKASLGVSGFRAMHEAASAACEIEPSGSSWRAVCKMLDGVALYQLGETEDGIARLEEARALSAVGLPRGHVVVLTELAMAEIDHGEWEQAKANAKQALDEVEGSELRDDPLMAFPYSVFSLVAAYERRPEEARHYAAFAQRFWEVRSSVAFWAQTESMIALGRAFTMLGDLPTARSFAKDARRQATRLGEAPVIYRRLEALEREVTSETALLIVEPLTDAEIRVAEYMSTHLTYREIAERLGLSRNTVKTHLASVYRKLNATTRSEAVVAARAVGLIGDVIDLTSLENEPQMDPRGG